MRLELVWNGRTSGSRTILRSICSIRMRFTRVSRHHEEAAWMARGTSRFLIHYPNQGPRIPVRPDESGEILDWMGTVHFRRLPIQTDALATWKNAASVLNYD